MYATNLIISSPSVDLIELLEDNSSFRGPDLSEENIFDTIFSNYDPGEIQPDENLNNNQFAFEKNLP